jgi:hypothetical protein
MVLPVSMIVVMANSRILLMENVQPATPNANRANQKPFAQLAQLDCYYRELRVLMSKILNLFKYF